MLWLFVGPTGVYLLDFVCSSTQFYLLLSPYLCVISLLYLDLYVLGNDALISYGSFMQTTSCVDLLCFCSVLCLLCLCARLFVRTLWTPNGKGLTIWLSFVVSTCEFVTFPLVSWVRCGT